MMDTLFTLGLHVGSSKAAPKGVGVPGVNTKCSSFDMANASSQDQGKEICACTA